MQMRTDAILAAAAVVVAVAGGGIAYGLWPSGVHTRPAPSAPVRNTGYCVEDSEHGHWTHMIGGTKKPITLEPGPCPANAGTP